MNVFSTLNELFELTRESFYESFMLSYENKSCICRN